MRMCFVQDDSGHWYAIPVERKEEFWTWLENQEEDEDWDRFEEYRLGSHLSRYSFENLEEN